jgi:general secretion pathway protein K
MTARPLLRQRGVAVVTALLLTTLAVTIVASLFWQQQVQVRSIENQRLQLQKQWVLRGALDWARLILREDAKLTSVDNLDEPWAVPLAETRLDQYVENGRTDTDAGDASLSGSIVDAQSRYNLRNLSVNGTVSQSEIAVFERLLADAGLRPALARATADMMAAAQSKPEAGTSNNAGGPRPMALTQIDDLLAVPGFNATALDKLRDFVIFLPVVTPINVNTAPAEVLAARIDTLSLADATALVASRKAVGFSSLADFSLRLPGKSFAGSNSGLAMATNYFLVNGKVRMSRAGLGVQALVYRDGTNTTLIWIREN